VHCEKEPLKAIRYTRCPILALTSRAVGLAYFARAPPPPDTRAFLKEAYERNGQPFPRSGSFSFTFKGARTISHWTSSFLASESPRDKLPIRFRVSSRRASRLPWEAKPHSPTDARQRADEGWCRERERERERGGVKGGGPEAP
jgi:hypothetical protein